MSHHGGEEHTRPEDLWGLVGAEGANLGRRHLSAYEGAQLFNAGLGIYLVNVIVNGLTISAVLDTGSGINHIACTGENRPATFLQAFAYLKRFIPRRSTRG